jgi:predicted glycosyltransferase
MRILIDIGHPAHLHYYRNLARELEKQNHVVFWTVKDIPVAKTLLKFYGFQFKQLPKKSDHLIGKIWKQLLYDVIIYWFCRTKKIDIAIGTSVSIAHISRISNVKSIVFDDDDDDVQPLVTKYVNPFADYLLSPEALKGKRKRKDTIYYPGYHELAYLHPKRFIPDPKVLTEAGIAPDSPFFIMRFNVFKAHHDKGIIGLSLSQKLQLIEILKPYGKIFITTEREIEPELKEFQLKVAPEKIHSLMSYATLFLGDSQTMTSEAAVLGIPSLRCNTFAGRISYIEEEEHKYHLTFGFKPEEFDTMVLKLKELLAISNLKEEWQIRKSRMLEEKIDVTSFWVWFIENLPKSPMLIEDRPEFWQNFR